MKPQKNAQALHNNDVLLSTSKNGQEMSSQQATQDKNLVIEALQKSPEARSKLEERVLKQYVQVNLPLMLQGYCSKDDYIYMAEKLQYKFVKQGHYVVRQGEKGHEVYNIISGSCNVVKWGDDEAIYLDSKAMYNEISLFRSRTNKTMGNVFRIQSMLEN